MTSIIHSLVHCHRNCNEGDTYFADRILQENPLNNHDNYFAVKAITKLAEYFADGGEYDHFTSDDIALLNDRIYEHKLFELGDRPIGDGGVVFNILFDTVATGGLGLGRAAATGMTRAATGGARVSAAELSVAAESATARAARLGTEGEAAVGLFGPKVGIRIPGANNMRFPDNLTTTTLTEVKNVGTQRLTRQLRDYMTYSRSNGLAFELYVRPSTHLTEPLKAAIRSEQITLKYIPGAQ